MIYKIKFNTITRTYYIYRQGKPVLLRKDMTRSMYLFMMTHKCYSSGVMTIWE